MHPSRLNPSLRYRISFFELSLSINSLPVQLQANPGLTILSSFDSSGVKVIIHPRVG